MNGHDQLHTGGFDPEWDRRNQEFRVLGERLLRDRTFDEAAFLWSEFGLDRYIAKLSSRVPEPRRDDLAGTLTVHLLKVFPKAMQSARPLGYLMTALRHAALSELRKWKRKCSLDDPFPEYGPSADVTDPAAGPAELTLQRASRDTCDRAIERLFQFARSNEDVVLIHIAEVVAFRYCSVEDISVAAACRDLQFPPEMVNNIQARIARLRHKPQSVFYQVITEIVDEPYHPRSRSARREMRGPE